MARHDVGIYMPAAANYYDAAAGTTSSGGAERQTVLLARSLAAAGLRTAHIVYPVAEPEPGFDVTLVERSRPTSFGSLSDLRREQRLVWKALDEADASVVVVRGAQGAVGLAALWARRRRRRVVFASANDSDFRGQGPFTGRTDPRGWLYRFGRAAADVVVVQTESQEALAEPVVRRGSRLVRIPSFVEPGPATEHPGEALLWVSRLADYKRPMLYLDLAEALPEVRFWMIPSAVTDPASKAVLAEIEQRAAGLDNLELLPQLSHRELQERISRAVAMVNTSSYEGMPNTWLEGWARGIPALTFAFDPDERIASNGLGGAAGGDWERFLRQTRELWAGRADRAELSARVRGYVQRVHGTDVAAAWLHVVSQLPSA